MLTRVITLCLLSFATTLSYGQVFQESTNIDCLYSGFGVGTTFGGGVSFADFNGDGLDDLTFATTSGSPLSFFKNDGGNFLEIPPLVSTTGEVKQVLWIDYDNDGDKDLFVTEVNASSKLYRNDGNLIMTDVSTYANIPMTTFLSFGAVFGDFDNDGWLDLYISNWGAPNVLLKNNQNGTFTDITQSQNVSNGVSRTFCSAFFDYNKDLYPELFLAQDLFPDNVLFANNNGTYTDVTALSNMDYSMDAMGIAVGDYDMDGDFDLAVSNSANNNNGLSGNALFENNNNETFTNTAIQNNIIMNSVTWGLNWFDYDNDSDLDLYVCTSAVGPANALFENIDGNGFLPHSIPGDTTKTYSNAIGDINDDGKMDVVACGSHGFPFVVYENQTPGTGNWIKILLEGTQSNRDGIGAEIEVRVANEKRYHYTQNATGFLAQNSSNHHFGLGFSNSVKSITVKWPSGTTDLYSNISANQKVIIVEGEGLYPFTCGNGLEDGDEAGLDCGGRYCPPCECNDSLLVLNVNGNFPLDSTLHYEEFFRLSNAATINPNTDVNIFAGNYLEILDGEINPGTGNVLLDIKECYVDDICYNTTLCNTDHLSATDLAGYTIARLWIELLLESIRNDYARPTIHARNLFHASAMMYDIWRIYKSPQNQDGNPYLVNTSLNGFSCPFNLPNNALPANGMEESISFAMTKLLKHRFAKSPSKATTSFNINGIMDALAYDASYTGTNYQSGNAADIGNYIAQCYIDYGLQDGSNEINDYTNQFYQSTNPPLNPHDPGNSGVLDPNKWQPLSLDVFIDQSGNQVGNNVPEFLSPEWGEVLPFSLPASDLDVFFNGSNFYKVYKNPGTPPMLGSNSLQSDYYKWGFLLVSVWSSHLDVNDNVTIDISPASIGNLDINTFPNYGGYSSFYNFNGGDNSPGHTINPKTGSPYAPQIVKRGDYARILAEFWADGPESETPPGHWFTLLNYVTDNFVGKKRFEGSGPVVGDLEWDIKSYFTLGGAMHDAAISAWSIKGYHDYIRPVSAIRYLAGNGQSSDVNLPNYHPQGMLLEPGYSELVGFGDPLAGANNEHVNKIKLRAWRGPSYINNPVVDEAGVGWILAENWWPYQRPSFVTPPFAGFVSGHSTFSRAAAEVLTMLTGDPYFPGGMGEFKAAKDDYLVFEQGPSDEITLQWATYRDASDQCSLSRIWGGIHPPCDDIPGRQIGEEIGIEAFNKAKLILGF